jgi:DNA-binding transcriptional MocR family regulator
MLPVHLQPESHVPLYVQLRDQLRALVHAGDLRPGDRIPASRELATMLGVHRTTVANAYAELESEGLIQGHVGRGTFIKSNGNGLKLTPPAPPVLNGNHGIRWELLFADERGDEVLSRLTASAPENALSFVMARPAQEFFPIDELQTCVATVLRREGAEVLNLGPSDGYPPLKEALLELLRREGLTAKDENLLITDGCQQSLDLISKAFVRPGDSVILENPTYPGAVAIFNGARARCLGVPVRTHPEPGISLGIDVEALEATLAANRVKLIVDSGCAAKGAGPGGSAPGAGGGRPHLCAVALAGRTRTFAQTSGPNKSGDSHRQFREGSLPGIARGLDCGSSGGH